VDKILIKIWNFVVALIAFPFICVGAIGVLIACLEIDDKVTNMYDYLRKSKNFKEVK
jgi:hypothetical protein